MCTASSPTASRDEHRDGSGHLNGQLCSSWYGSTVMKQTRGILGSMLALATRAHSSKEPHVGTVDTALNSADLGTKFHPRRRFAELLMMLPLGIGLGLISSYGAEELSMDRADRENRFVSSTSYLSVRGGSPVVSNSQLACCWEGTASPTHQESRPRIRMQSWSRTQRHSQCQVWFLQEGRS